MNLRTSVSHRFFRLLPSSFPITSKSLISSFVMCSSILTFSIILSLLHDIICIDRLCINLLHNIEKCKLIDQIFKFISFWIFSSYHSLPSHTSTTSQSRLAIGSKQAHHSQGSAFSCNAIMQL